MGTVYTNSGDAVTSPPDVLSSVSAEAVQRVAADDALETVVGAFGASIRTDGGLNHRAAVASENHVPQRWEVANAAARLALVPLAAELGGIAFQADDRSSWSCVGVAPAAWRRMDPAELDAYLVTSTGGTTARTLAARAADVAHLADFLPAGYVTDGSVDYDTQLHAAVSAAMSAGKRLVFPRGTYKFSTPLVISGIDVDFGGAQLFYAGAAGSFALSLNSPASDAGGQTNGNRFDDFTLFQSNFSAYVTATGSVVYDPPSIAGGSVISSIVPGGTSTTVSVAGATVGGFARASFTSSVDGIEITARVTAPDVVTVTFSNYSAGAIDMASGTINVSVVNNAYHGLALGGSLGRLRNAKIRGFTGVSLGMGDGVDVTTGVTFGGSLRAYYWYVDANLTPAAGWGLVVPPRNNENEFAISMFPANFYAEAPPRRASCINAVVVGGITNKFHRLSIELNSSEEEVLLASSANLNETTGVAYVETNASWVTPPFPRVSARSTTSANSIRLRHPYSGRAILDKGVANDIGALPANVVGGQQVLPPTLSRNLVVNGDFENGTTWWTNFSTGSTLTVPGAGFISGKRARLDLVAGRPNLQQDMHTVGGFNIAGLVGQNITFGAWIKTNIPGVKPRVGGITGNTGTDGDEIDQLVTVTYKVPPGATTLPLSIITEASGLTGYVEISNVTAYVGLQAASVGERSVLNGSATFDPASIPAGGQVSTTVACPGAVVGDFAMASFANDQLLVEISAYVSATDVVTVLFKNGTAGAVDLPSRVLRVRVLKV